MKTMQVILKWVEWQMFKIAQMNLIQMFILHLMHLDRFFTFYHHYKFNISYNCILADNIFDILNNNNILQVGV